MPLLVPAILGTVRSDQQGVRLHRSLDQVGPTLRGIFLRPYETLDGLADAIEVALAGKCPQKWLEQGSSAGRGANRGRDAMGSDPVPDEPQVQASKIVRR